MTRSRPDAVEHVRSVIHDVVTDVFDSVAVVNRAVLDCQRGAQDRGRPWCGQDITELRSTVRGLLEEPDDLLVGLGLVVAPAVLSDERLRLEWWQRPLGAPESQPLEVDLNPGSLHFYDYPAAEWFEVPRTTGRRHVVGPYVDVHGTGRYVLTFTAPVHADGRFLGVVGADVPVQRFEARVLREVRLRDSELILLGDQRRVVLSTSTRWLTGDLLPPDSDGPGSGPDATYLALDNLPWQLRMEQRPRLART